MENLASRRSAPRIMTLGSASSWRKSVTDDIGSRVHRARGHSTTPTFWNKLRWVVVAMMISFVVIHAAVALLQKFVIHQLSTDDAISLVHHHAHNQQGERTQRYLSSSASGKVVRAVYSWYQSLDENELVFGVSDGDKQANNGEDHPPNTDISCLDGLFETIMESGFFTSPALTELVLSNMGLQGHRPTRYRLRRLLAQPQDLSGTLTRTKDCVAQMTPLAGLCQVATQFEINLASKGGDNKQTDVIGYLLNLWAVHETLTAAATDDLPFMFSLSEAAFERRKDVEQAIQSGLAGASRTSQITTGETDHAFDTLAFMTSSLLSGSGFNGLKDITQLNILNYVMVDALDGRRSNALLGLALASTVLTAPTVTDNQEVVWRLGKEWIEAYIAWRFTSLVTRESLHHAVGLVVPSIACSAAAQNGDSSFVTANVISSALASMHLPLSSSQEHAFRSSSKFTGNNTTVDHGTQLHGEFLQSEFRSLPAYAERRSELADNMGKSNLERVMLPNPYRRQVSTMLRHLCGKQCATSPWMITDSSPYGNLDEEDFLIYVAVVVWLTVLISGLGCELLFWVILSQQGWSDVLETRWWFAQFCFPLFAMTCFGLATLRDYLALPFLVAGLWKFGMPETLSYMYSALFDVQRSYTGRVADLLNSIGTIIHHSSATIIICILLTGVTTSNRYIIGPILILIMQHWFVLTKYVSVWLYSGLELVLEFWFQWVVLSNLQHLQGNHWITLFAALGMFTAHWLYLIGAGLEMFSSVCGVSANNETCVTTKATFKKRRFSSESLSPGPARVTRLLSISEANKKTSASTESRKDKTPLRGFFVPKESTELNSGCSDTSSEALECEV